jgi:TP901 family phage tail tape measure protein
MLNSMSMDLLHGAIMVRTTVEVKVLGMQDLQKLNTELRNFEKNVLQAKDAAAGMTGAFSPLNRSLGSTTASASKATNQISLLNKEMVALKAGGSEGAGSLTRVGQATGQAGNQAQGAVGKFSSLLATMVGYKAVSLVFSALSTTIHGATQALEDYDKQAARSTRIIGTDKRPLVSAAMREATATTGAEAKDAGEVFYQLGTYIGNTTELLKAYRSEMLLISGTEADARTASRASIQVYEEFGHQLGANVSDGEKFRRINELLAISFKTSSAELNENAQALKFLAPVAETARVKVEQLFAVISALSATGVRGRMSGTETGAFITRLVKAYDHEQGGISFKGQVSKFNYARNSDGGLDILKTMEGIYRRHAELLKTDKDAADRYYVAIGGSAQAIRFLGGMNDETFKKMRENVDKNVQAVHGLTHEVDALHQTMNNTFSQQSAAVWQGFLGVISSELEKQAKQLGIIAGLRGLAEHFQRHSESVTEDENMGVTLRDPKRGVSNHARDLTDVLGQAMQTFAKQFPGESPQQMMGPGHDRKLWNLRDDMGPNAYGGVKALFPGKQEFGAGPQALSRISYKELSDKQAEMNSLYLSSRANAFAAPTLTTRATVADSVSFRVEADRKRVNQGLLAEVEKAAKDLGMALTVGTAITGHSLKTTTGNRSRHVDGNAFDITAINGLPVLAGKKGGDLADKLVKQLAEQGFEFGEGGHNKAFLWKTNIGGNHFNHLHVSDTTRPDWMNDRDKAEEAAAKDDSKKRKQVDIGRRSALDTLKESAEIDLERTKRDFGPFDTRTLSAARLAQQRALAAADPMERKRLQLGLSGEMAQLTEEQKKARQDVADRHAGVSAFYADIAPQKYGIFSETSEKRAREAQEAAIKAELLKGKEADPAKMLMLRAAKTGPLFDYHEKYSEASGNGNPFAVLDSLTARGIQNQYVEGRSSATDRRLRDVELGSRQENLYTDQNAASKSRLQQSAQVLREGITELEKIKSPTQETTSALEQMRDKLAETSKGLIDLADSVGAQSLKDTLSRIQSGAEIARQKLDQAQLPTVDDKGEAEKKRLEDLLAINGKEVGQLALLAIGNFGAGGTGEAFRQASQGYSQSQAELRRHNAQSKLDDSEELRSALKTGITDFLHGKGSPLDIVKGAGDAVAHKALDDLIKSWTDPLANLISGEVEAMKSLTEAVIQNTAAQEGVSGGSGGAGGGGGLPGSGKGGKGKGTGRMGQYLGYGLAAYSVAAQGADQGVTLGSALNGALTGFAMGGPIGAAIGLGADLLGGLFHRRKKTDPQQDNNPALQHGPSDFDYYAYRYRATGQLPSQSEVSGYHAPAVVNNIYVDGVKQAVRTEVAQQTSSQATAQSSSYLDIHRPIG